MESTVANVQSTAVAMIHNNAPSNASSTNSCHTTHSRTVSASHRQRCCMSLGCIWGMNDLPKSYRNR